MNVFVIDIAAVLDGIDSGEDRGLDAQRAVSVGGDFAAESVGGFDDGAHFLGAVLLKGRIVAFGEDSAGG